MLHENRTLKQKIEELRMKNMKFRRDCQALQTRYNNLKASKKPGAVKGKKQNQVKQLQRKITKLGDKVTKQKSEFEEKLACKKRKEMTTAAKKKELESETNAETSLQAQVVELEHKLKNAKCKLVSRRNAFARRLMQRD